MTSPNYFVVSGKDYEDVRRKLFNDYGDRARILTRKEVPASGLLGLFGQRRIECTCYLSSGLTVMEKDQQQRSDKQSKKEILNMVGYQDEQFQQLAKDIRMIKESVSAGYVQEEIHPSLKKIGDILEDNDFSPSFIHAVSETLRREFALDDLENFALVQQSVAELIAKSIRVYEPSGPRFPLIQILVGPTGVGKTTTVAKLAALQGLSPNRTIERRIRIVTIDSYRIGARAQIEIYGDIMSIPVELADNYEDLKNFVEKNGDVDFILVDTIGKGPQDYQKLAEMRRTLEGAGTGSEIHLAISATTKTPDIKEILRQFEFFNYEAVVLTKLDETTRVGNLISVLADRGIPIFCLTTGQSVPSDIEREDIVGYLMGKLKNFEFDMETIRTMLSRKALKSARRS
ncbi:MAG: flagellar biosynthesis protein FlhF [Spirochaetales bacterium]|nr:flagellar biosynthesis protein FlhF [Spirochaetales bacterium]